MVDEQGLRTLYGDDAVDPNTGEEIGPADDDNDNSGGGSRDRDRQDSDDQTVSGPENDGDPSTTLFTPPDSVTPSEDSGPSPTEPDFSTNPRPEDTADAVSGNSGSVGADDTSMPDESGDMPEDSGSAARKLDGSTGSTSVSGGGGGGDTASTPDGLQAPPDGLDRDSSSGSTGGGDSGGTPDGLQAPPDGLDETSQSRDVEDIEPSAASEDPDPMQGVEEGGQFENQAEQLENEVIQQAEEQVGREFSDEDVRVTRTQEDGERKLEAEFTETGRDQIDAEQFQREFQAKQELENQIQRQTEEQLTRGDDFVIETREDGDTTVFEVEFETGPTDQDVSPSVTPTGTDADEEDGDIFSGAVSGTEDALSEVAQVASGNEDARVEFQGEGSVVNQARQEEANASGDRFGDVDVTLPFTDIEIGATTAAAGEAFNERVAKPAGDITGDVADVTESGATVFGASNPALLLTGRTDTSQIATEVETGDERIADIARGPQNEQSSERGIERFAEGAGTGAVNIVNLPGVANTVIEAGEFGVEAGEQTAAGRGGEFATAAGGAGVLLGARAAKSAQENPASFGGQVVGSTLASGGAIGAARKVGGASGGRAAAAAIQPGEELAIAAARRGAISQRVATAVPGVRKEQFVKEGAGGSGDPLVDIEVEGSGSTAVESTDFRGDDSRVSAVKDRVADNVGSFFGDRRGQVGGGGRRTRQRQRQRQEQEPEPVIEIDVENDPLVRGLERDRQSQENSFESASRSDIETRLEVDSRARAVQRLESRSNLTAAQSPSVGLDAGFAPGVASRERAGVDALTEPTVGTELGTRPATETATESAQELNTELRTELAVESATETRTEARTELLTESRRETDTDDLLEDAEDLTTPTGTDTDIGTRRFEYDIATPEEVLSGETGVDL